MEHIKKFDQLFEKKITKDEKKVFLDDAINTIKKHNGVSIGDDYRYTVETTVGQLSIHIREDINEMYMIFMRFAEPEKAKELVDCDPNSGKFNILDVDAAYVLTEFEERLVEVGAK